MPGSKINELSKFRVSVVIPVFNDLDRLKTCLDALALQTWPQDQLEVLVVDNGSQQDIAPALAAYESVRLLRETQPGSYAARNRALREITSNVVAFTDSDCVPDPHWLENGVRQVQRHGPRVVVGGRVALFARDAQRPTVAEDFELALGFSQKAYVEQKHYSVTANLFTTPHVFAEVGPFNASLSSGGDKEWGIRAHEAGVSLRYAQDALVRHPARRTMAELFSKRARLVGGHLGIARSRYPEWVAFSVVFAKACAPPLGRLLKTRHPTSATESVREAEPSASSAADPSGQIRRYVRVFGVGVSLQAYSALELLRLKFGKKPAR